MTTPTFNTVEVRHAVSRADAIGNDYVLVARVQVDTDLSVEAQLEQAYRATQNFEGSWSQGQRFDDGSANRDYNPFVTRVAPLHVHNGRTYGLRSSMMGDRFTLIARSDAGIMYTYYVVASCGFDVIEHAPVA